MTGFEKLAVMLIGIFLTLSALSAGGQQTSNAAQDTPPQTSAAPPSAAPLWPANMPPNPPKVTCDGDKLTISAQNSTLGAVLNAIRACTGAEIDVPEDAKGERLFAELGPGPLRTVVADFLSSMDFDYVIKASPADPQKIQMVLLNPRTSDSPSEVATLAGGSTNTNMTSNRQGWLKARENYMKSFSAARDDSNQQADTASSAPVEAAAPAAGSVPVEAAAPAAGSVPVEAATPAAGSVPVEATAPAASSVPLGAEPASPAPSSSPVPLPATNPIAAASSGSDTAPSQGAGTQQMISNMERMFEQRKQMIQQQQTSAPPP